MSKDVQFLLNGQRVSSAADGMSRLLDVLRNEFDLYGVKEGCGEGECGACAVLLDGRLVNSCLIPLAMVEQCEVKTIEEIKHSAKYKIIENSFAEAGAVQCGFCTPGMVMAAYDLLSHNQNPSETEVRDAISGQLCRCTGYQMIVDGVLLAAEKMRFKNSPPHRGRGKGNIPLFGNS